MTAAEFKKKWSRNQSKESAAYQEHFNDLCRLLGQPTPNEADPSGSDFFCFQKRVVKDAELFELHETPDASEPAERGFADVWKKGCFAWEYKGKKKNLDEAYKQLLRYRESLLNPPLLVVCDFDRYIVKTNFNGTVQEVHEFTNDQIDRPENLRILRALFTDPEFLKPQRTTAQVTKTLAEKFAQVAVSLQKRESAEYADARTREEFRVEQKKNLRIARFLNRLVFCFFAEDTGLLPKNLFSEIAKIGLENKDRFIETLQRLFRVMAKGGNFGKDKIRYFNGHLFEDSTVFDLSDDERRLLAEASEADWQFVEPSIMGTLFARGLDPDQRAALGAQYTSREDIVTIVEPVLMAPLRREWAALKASLLPAFKHGKATPADRARIAAFLKKLRQIIVLDPACGSGNFLYVSLQLLLGLEKEVITFAEQLGFSFQPEVSVQQLKAIEINPYAFELAQVSVQIGYLQWLRDNGFPLDRSPVLQNLDGFDNEDALLVPHFHSKAKTLKEAQAGEHQGDNTLKFYTEREWPKCDVLVSNPPFLGGKLIRRELGNSYVDALFENLGKRVPPEADLCCYWFEKARQQVEHGKCKRAGLLATQGIRGGANREVLKRIKDTGDIFFAESDRPWILAGANVHVSMVGFDNGAEKSRVLNGKTVKEISPQLDAESKTHTATIIEANTGISFMGITPAGPFDISSEIALEWLNDPNPSGKPNSDVLRPYFNGNDLTKRAREAWTVDFGVDMPLEIAASYEKPFTYLEKEVKTIRGKNRREAYAKNWWIYAESRPAMRESFSSHLRFLATCMVAKHRMFVWLDTVSLPANVVIAFGRSDDFFLGLLQCKFHEVWSLKQGTRLETRPRYTPTTCFETFPFPCPTPAQEAAIAAAAKELNQLRERWLNPPEWTVEKILEFPGSIAGPWARYIDKSTIREVGRVTPCAPGRTAEDCHPYLVGFARYPRLVPKDADCAAKLKERTLTKLYNERPAWLDLAHKKLDAAVAAAYGFPADLTDEQILEKLLALNLARAAEEAKSAKVKQPKTTRDKKEDEMI
jgi:type II restriction/modification system DNA methylase subunit YeeA